MSFDVYIQCFGATERTGIPRQIVRALFPLIEDESQPDSWRVQYDEFNACNVFVSANPSNNEFLNSLSVWRPCEDPRLWQALIELLRMGSVVMYWPGSPPIIANDISSSSLPKDIVDSFGPPRSVHSVEDIYRLLRET